MPERLERCQAKTLTPLLLVKSGVNEMISSKFAKKLDYGLASRAAS